MLELRVSEAGPNTWLIEPRVNGYARGSLSYLIKGRRLCVIEAGPSNTAPMVIRGIEELGFAPADVEYVALTHIHADHGGGLGLLLERMPGATVLVHRRGVKHLIDPSSLIAGTRQVWGDNYESIWGPILPVPGDRVQAVGEGDQVDLGESHILTVYDTPGHAPHHLAFLDAATGGFACGESFGHYYPDLGAVLPGTAPPQFDLDATIRDIDRALSLPISTLLFSHYGFSSNAREGLAQAREYHLLYAAEMRDCLKRGLAPEQIVQRLLELMSDRLNLPAGESLLRQLRSNCSHNVDGYLPHLNKQA